MADWIVKYDGPCSKCGTMLRTGEPAVWIRGANRMECIECPSALAEDPSPPPIETGVAGGSARREEERRLAKREADNKDRWGERVGGWVTRFGETPQSIRAWGLGARGEELLGEALGQVPGLIVLNDRRVQRTKGNIDHILVAPSGVFVVDAKFYQDRMIEVVDRGGLFRRDLRLTVGRRDKSNLADDMEWQVKAVIRALGDGGIDPLPRITAILCFIDASWPRFRPPKSFNGVLLESERSIVRLLTATTELASDDMDRIARALAFALPSK